MGLTNKIFVAVFVWLGWLIVDYVMHIGCNPPTCFAIEVNPYFILGMAAFTTIIGLTLADKMMARHEREDSLKED